MIGNCDKCSKSAHEQDNIHGKGLRVINEHKTKIGERVRRCTRCGHETRQTATEKSK